MKYKTFAVDIDGTITEDNQSMTINLDALSALRRLTEMGHNVIFVTGRSSVEGFLLAVTAGTTKIAVGENGGCITDNTNSHTLLGDIATCKHAFAVLQNNLDNVRQMSVFPRMTEVILERTFDLDLARDVLSEHNIDVVLSDSHYAYHINSLGINKGTGFTNVMNRMSITLDDVIAIGDSLTDIPLFQVAKTSVALGNASEQVKSHATMTVSGHAGNGILEALDKLAPQLLL